MCHVFKSTSCGQRNVRLVTVHLGAPATSVPLLQDPHLLEGGEVQSDSLLLQAVSNAGVLLNSVSRHDGVDVHAFPDVHNILFDEIVGGLWMMQVSITRKLGWKTLEHPNLLLLMVVT